MVDTHCHLYLDDFKADIAVFCNRGTSGIDGSTSTAIGAAVDNETDSQQFQLPITAPLLLTFYVIMISAFKNPDSEALYWLSMIPLTSPVV